MLRAAVLAVFSALLCAASPALALPQPQPLLADGFSTAALDGDAAVAGEPRELAAIGSRVMSEDDLLVRRLAHMADATNEAQRREQARVLFKLYKTLNPSKVKAWGATEEEQFEQFYKSVFQSMLAQTQPTSAPSTRAPAPGPTTQATPAPSGSTPSSSPAGTSSTNKPVTPSSPAPGPAPSSAPGATPAPAPTLFKGDKGPTYQVTDSLSFFSETYDPKYKEKLRNLQDNTANMEAIVQSTKGPGSGDPSDTFQGPIVVEKDQPGSGRRLADAKSQFDLMFCDVGGNAIWKLSAKDEKPKTNTTTTTTTVIKPSNVCEATKVVIKVTAYQSGCSRKLRNDCDKVYYKGCGGLTVNQASNRIVVARTGGRSLGVMYYKQMSDTCQGRVLDAIDKFRGRKFNSPTFAEYNKRGDLFFTDSPFGLAKSSADFEGDILDKSPERELPFNGVFVLRNGAKKVDLVDCFMDRPNKIAFSPKQDIMYVTNSRKGNSYVKKYEFKQDGTVGSMKTFFNFTAHPELKTNDGYADGIKVDADGMVYVAVSKAVYVLTPEGNLIGSLQSNQQLNGLALGAGRLFVTGSFGVVAQPTASQPSLPVPKAKNDC
ncbi:hypothetical protein P43SY_004818 [Pythium insidiosum]|uniref:SMP-30/Gluconolactonase/LRE-like region domain-containing protein n=1 Tax=Pythium insidiosum TaxID=114742 RepID=A0AAD5QAB4_PYTIN|nr:hypothetical protein P43SY_004818 [Pythium insidiosum]